MIGFSEDFRKLAIAYHSLIDFITDTPDNADPEDIDFLFGRPCQGFLPLYIIRNGKKQLICTLCDIYPPFEKIKNWLERASVISCAGFYCSEMVTLDCLESTVTFLLIQTHWRHSTLQGGINTAMSVLQILQVGSGLPTVFCLCDTEKTMRNLYRAMFDCLRRNRTMFDDYKNWTLYERKWLDDEKNSNIILEQLRSKRLEIF